MSFAAIGGALIGTAGTMYASDRSADSAGASNKDYRNLQFSDEQATQLQQMLSSMDKNVAEEIFGTETLQQLQEQVSQSQQQQSTTGSQSEQTSQEQNQQTSTDQTTTGQQDTTSQQQTDQQTTTQLGDEATRNRLTDLINNLGGGESASQAMDVAMQKVLRDGAPAISNVGNRSGTFNSSQQGMLQNDLAVRAAEAGTQASLNQRNQEMSQLLQALNLGQQGTASENTTGVTSGQQSTTSQEQMQQMQDVLSQLFGNTQTDTSQQTDTTQQNSSQTSTDSTSTSEQNRNANEQTTTEQTNQTDSNSQSASDQFYDTDSPNSPFGNGVLDLLYRGENPGRLLGDNTPAEGIGEDWGIQDPRGTGSGGVGKTAGGGGSGGAGRKPTGGSGAFWDLVGNSFMFLPIRAGT